MSHTQARMRTKAAWSLVIETGWPVGVAVPDCGPGAGRHAFEANEISVRNSLLRRKVVDPSVHGTSLEASLWWGACNRSNWVPKPCVCIDGAVRVYVAPGGCV